MTTVYKLTDKDDRTRAGWRNETQWGEGVTNKAPGKGLLCTDGWIHVYASPLLAVLMNPAHARYDKKAHLWECEADAGLDGGTKMGCTRVTTLRRIPIPTVTPEQHVRFAILCVLAAGKSTAPWRAWAKQWLDGTDRSETSAALIRGRVLSMEAQEVADAAQTLASDGVEDALCAEDHAAHAADDVSFYNRPAFGSTFAPLAERAVAEENAMQETS